MDTLNKPTQVVETDGFLELLDFEIGWIFGKKWILEVDEFVKFDRF